MKQVIILFGPPGAGKGTQAELLSDKLNLYYFETSKILEEKFKEIEENKKAKKEVIIKNKKYNILDEKKLWKEGKLCTPLFVAYLVKEKIKELNKEGKNLILAGSPRTLEEAKEIIPLLKKLYGKNNIKVFFIEISPEQTIFRNSNRKICELFRHPILYNKETKKLTMCPLDGSKLIRREGLDDIESIKIRLKEYQERTFPLIEYFKKEKLWMKKINGEQSVADVYYDIVNSLK
ncbi:MAG TPA: nucleoside monophosphate kinase [Candidatus Pacearchaeota archaeon]|nr:nucleoside monophosphate kinase [Candidatus Paceibacterota bacterium]HOW12709.1 nucleoside monophosphate kinase [Candidatus Pacearchaeota archaeon]HPO68275.1 nucleoside monophosphate kinase [Candidatus Pacearchaeota archaeon]